MKTAEKYSENGSALSQTNLIQVRNKTKTSVFTFTWALYKLENCTLSLVFSGDVTTNGCILVQIQVTEKKSQTQINKLLLNEDEATKFYKNTSWRIQFSV